MAKTNAQGTFVNRSFQNTSGSPVFNPILNNFGIQWSKSITTSARHLLTVGHTYVSGQGENVFLIEYDTDGNILFQKDQNTFSTNNDYGIGVYEAANGDILVCGTTDNGGTNDYDVLVMRFDANGNFLNIAIENGPAGKNDFAVDISEDSGGNVIVAANTEDSNGLFDFWALKFSGGLMLNANTPYDYTGLNDIALGLEITGGGTLRVIRASASSATACDYVTVHFNSTSLVYVSETRNNLPGTVHDQALAFYNDASGNTYITGKTWNGSSFNLKTVKVSSGFTIAWTTTLNVHGGDDVANTITLDPVNGDVIIGGFATKANNKKEMICQRLDAASGAILKTFVQSSENATGDAVIKKIATNLNGDVYFVGGETGNSGKKQVVVGKLKQNGDVSWQRKISDQTKDILPSDIVVEPDGIFIISFEDGVADSYLTTHYDDMELDTTRTNYGDIKYKEGELIVRFNRSALNYSAINNQGKEFGNLSEFLTGSAYSAVLGAFDRANICVGSECNVKAIKIFPGQTTNDSTAISRLGETVAIPDLWTALLLKFPNNYGVINVSNVFNNNLTSVANYAEPNFLARTFSASNDSLYVQQYSIRSNTVYPNADVNAEEAWDVIPNGGRSFVRAGVFDEVIDWEHRDFNYDGVNPASSKIIDGYSFTNGVPIKSLSGLGGAHGTAVGGIIGAQRNNIGGIAGIAGGNDSTGSKGIELYNLAIFDAGGTPTISPQLAPLSYIANAIVTSTKKPDPNSQYPYQYNLHLQNHSWGLETSSIDPGFVNQSITLFKEAIHTVNRIKVTTIAARGNNIGTKRTYPANCDDDWVICVSGTGIDGQFAHNTPVVSSPFNCEFTSAWGGDIDVAAPCSGSLVTTTYPAVLGPNYTNFGGTSVAAPHVASAVGLLMSYMNDSTDTYKNLAPEDCEAIIQITATDTDSTGYDQLTGFGRLNIGKAMKRIQKPYNDLLHFGTNNFSSYSVSKVQVGSLLNVNVFERFQLETPPSYPTVQSGVYTVIAHKITSTVYHNISPQDTIVAYWPRPSSSVTWNLHYNVAGTNYLAPRQKTKIVSLNHSQAVLEGYVYEVKSGTTTIGWWPVDTAYIQDFRGNWAEYSVLVRNSTQGVHTQIKAQEVVKNDIAIFPNPTSGMQFIEIYTDKVSDLNIDLYDIMGRKLKTVYSGKSETSRTVVKHDVSDLVNSLYIYNITLDGKSVTRKFLKQ